ncbi:MAG: FAD-binding oxidoreductase [Chloroflexi bacterium]|nr:FAD-binding oxidoreductase [Chloroflexota bacterium]
MSQFPSSSSIVIIGGGVMGASTAYHLARRGYTDVVLLEREAFFGLGATGRCAGGIRYQFSTEINIRLSVSVYPCCSALKQKRDRPSTCNGPVIFFFLLTNERDVGQI